MKLLGLTGGIGMGKTAAANWLTQRGVPVVDTDFLARQVVEPGQPALREIGQLFGAHLIDPDGRLRRADLAEIVFGSPEQRHQLESILHPRIREAWAIQVRLWEVQGKPLAVVVIPLLFETGAGSEFDSVICVACSPRLQQQRLRPRGWTREQIDQRVLAQYPIEDKMARAHFVVWNEGPLAVMGEQLERVICRVSTHELPR